MASVDVLVPSYNYGRYLASCVHSVLAQDVACLRVLVIDNASTDDSATVARRLAASDSRIELRLRKDNLGPHASFNEGIDWAASDYFLILCADDLLPPGALRRAVEIMESDREISLVFGRTAFFGDRLPPPDAEPARQRPDARIVAGDAFLATFCNTGRSPVGGPSAIVRTSAQKHAGHYRADLTHTDDVEMWMRFSCLGSVAEIDAVQVLARLHPANQSAAVSDVHMWNIEMERAFEAFFSDWGARLPHARRLRRIARHSLANRAYWCAASHLLRGDPGVLDLIRFAVTRRPSLALFPPLGSLIQRDDALHRVGSALAAMRSRLPLQAARTR